VNALAPLRHAPFRNLVLGRTISGFGNSVAPLALAFAVLDLTGSVSDLGLVVGVRSLFNVIFILLGGVIADRLPRQFVMVTANVLAGASQAVTAGLFFTHHATIPLLLGLGAFNGTVAALNQPAAAAVLGQVVPPELRREANALNRLGLNAVQIVGTASGGLLVAAFGSAWGLAIDAATFLVAVYFYALLRVPSVREPEAERAGIGRELREGWSEFVSRTWVWVVVLAFTFYNMAIVAALAVLGPAVADATFGRRAWGIILAAEVVGNIVGGLLALRFKARRLLLVGVLGCAGAAFSAFGLGVWPYVGVLVPLFFLGGVGVEQFGIAWEVSLQEHVPAEKLARVYSYDMLGSFIAIPAGQMLAGPLAIATSVRTALVISAGILVLAVVAMLASRSVRRLEHHPAPAATPDPEPVPVTP
jgi:MFS family permease